MRLSMMVTYIMVILITLILMSTYVAGILTEKLYDNEKVELFAKANIIAGLVSEKEEIVTDQGTSDNILKVLSGTGLRSIIVNPAYNVVIDTGVDINFTGKIFMREILKTSLEGEQDHVITISEQGAKILAVSVPVKCKDKITGAVYLFQNIENTEKMIASVKMNMIVFSAIISILVGILSFGMSYIITSPLDEVTSVAKSISKGDFSKKLSEKGYNEFSQMAEAMNYMSTELENLEENRKKFVSDVSHELKTPLATIKLICDSLVSTENPDPEMTREFLNDLSDEVDRLSRIVERLLALTRMDSGNTEPQLAPVDFVVMMNAIVKKLTPTAEAKNVNLYTEFEDTIYEPLNLDYDKIWESIYNIVDNAIKYSKEGGFVKVGMAIEEGYVAIHVQDNGEGIPENEQDKIFDRFYRIDDSRARDTGGTGLGLAIAKEAVLLHGGEIGVKSTEGMGSDFYIRLPYNKIG